MIQGSGSAYYLPKFTDTRVMANSSIQENAVAQIGIGGSLDVYFKLRITGGVYVDDSFSGNGIALTSNLEHCPLSSRQMNTCTTGGKAPYIGRWGLFMEPNELFLVSPGADFNSGCVSIGGYLANGTKQSNLTVNNYTGMVGIGTTTLSSILQVNCTIIASSFVRSGGTSSQYLMADGSTSSFVSSSTNAAKLIFSIFNNDNTFNSIKAGRGISISLPINNPQNLLTFDVSNILVG